MDINESTSNSKHSKNMSGLLRQSLLLRLSLIFVVIFALSIVAAAIWVPDLIKRNAIHDATRAAQDTVNQYKALRKYYTQNIVKKVIGESDFKASFEHKNIDNMIPLPATMIHDLSKLQEKEGTTIRLYSAFPFPNRDDRKLDQFQQDAWNYLQANPDSIFVKSFNNDGKNSVRVAIADKMVDESCVGCHNSHPDTPKVGWKFGDVRGVLEVDGSIDAQIANGIATARIIIAGLIVMAIIIISLLWFFLRSWVTKPLKYGTDFVNHLTEENINDDIKINSQDEVGQLLRAIVNLQNTFRKSHEKELEQAEVNRRIKQALDKASANVMMTDAGLNITYLNTAVMEMFNEAEFDIRKDLPNFDSKKLLGVNIDVFNADPSCEYRDFEEMDTTFTCEFGLGGRMFRIIANPVFSANHERAGTIMEWEDRTQELVVEADVQALVDSALAGDLSQRIDLANKQGFFERLSQGVNELVDVSERVINDTLRVLGAMAQGDLTETIDDDYQGAFGQLRHDANEVITKLTDVVGNIKSSADSVSAGSSEINQGNTNLSQRTEQQAANLEETSSGMEEMTITVQQNADNAQQANQLAINACEQAENGGKVVGTAVAAMNEINNSSKKIADIIGVIDEIAFQTNLLALNASVEAARAGEQGRGFAVVASEVRNLAGRSATAAKEIKELIEDSVDRVKEGSKFVNESGETLNEIVKSVKKVTDIIGEISASSQEQATGIQHMNRSISQMTDMTQQNVALVEQVTAASGCMSQEAEELNKQMNFFSVNDKNFTKIREPVSRNKHDQVAFVERRSANRPWSGSEAAKISKGDKSTSIAPVASLKKASGTDHKGKDWKEF